MNRWVRFIGIALLVLSLSSFGLGLMSLVGLVQVSNTTQAQRDAAARNACVTDTYAPFYRGVALGLLELDARSQTGDLSGGVLTRRTRTILEDASADLNTIEDRCPIEDHPGPALNLDWQTVGVVIAAIAATGAVVLGIQTARRTKAIDTAINTRAEGEPTMSEDIAASRARDEAQDSAAADSEARADPGSADRAASSTADED